MDFELGSGIRVDTARLIDTRLLIQSNSGGGKSWALRRVLEQTHGQVQHLVIDPEGEFATLREKYDYVLAARHDGDTVADPRSAKLLAERLLELGASAILDIYELKAHDRVRFVRHFLEALVDAPKKLWHPALVVVDEAHVYMPQVGDAESSQAVIDLCTRGRKRGFSAILATQRLSKLHKDGAAECNNKLIGRTGLDVDVKRAADELGFGKERWRELRELPAGHFFGFGPALAREVRPIHVGPVFTTHPKAGARLTAAPPAPSAKVRAVLSQLADLPAEAEKREKTVEDLRRTIVNHEQENAELRRLVNTGPPAASPQRVEVPMLGEDDAANLHQAALFVKDATENLRQGVAAIDSLAVALGGKVVAIQKAIDMATSGAIPVVVNPDSLRPWRDVPAIPFRTFVRSIPAPTGPGENLGKGERAILTALAQNPEGRYKVQVAMLSGYSHNGGRFNNLLGVLRSRGWIDDGGAGVRITQAGIKALGTWEPLPSGRALRVYWARELGTGEGKVLDVLAAVSPRGLSKEEIAHSTDYEAGGGRFNNILGRLRTLELITGRGEIKLAEELAG